MSDAARDRRARLLSVSFCIALPVVFTARGAYGQDPQASAVPPATPGTVAQPPVETLTKTAQKAAEDAKTSKTAEDAKAGVLRAEDAKKAIDILQPTAAEPAAQALKTAQQAYEEKKRAENSLCGIAASGDGPRSVCLVYGLFAAALSKVRVTGEGSEAAQRLTSIAVPFAGVRLIPQLWFGLNEWGIVSLDIAGYSAFLSQSVTATTPSVTKTSCSRGGGDFEAKLPCEANGQIHPYLGGYVGVTVGRSGLAYVTIIPFTLGLAQVGAVAELRTYYGWSVGAIQLNGNL